MSTLIILALVFVFVALRLWSVLGRRTGHEQTIAKPADAPAGAGSLRGHVPQVDKSPTLALENASDPSAAAGLRAIVAADPQFDVAQFVEGAKAAYRMVLEAYWQGDEQTLRRLVDDEVADAFVEAIVARRDAGEVLDNRLVTIEQAQIEQARLDGQTAHIRVRFDADVAAVTRDRDGNVIAGSLTDAVPTHDVWTFSRNTRDADPNWTLTETDEAA